MQFKGDFVYCPVLGSLEILRDHLLVVDDRGFITHLGPTSESASLLSETTIIVPRGSFLLPTFCDLHLHAPQFLYQGTGLHLPLMQWLNEYAFQAEEKLDADGALAHRVYTRLAERLVQNGAGAVLLFGTIKTETNIILARVMQAAGIRAFVGKLSMDISSRPSYVEPSAQDALAGASSFADTCKGLFEHLPAHRRLVEPVITPRFVPTCSEELLAGLGRLAEEKQLRIQSHLAEALEQVKWVKDERGVDDIEVFERNNLLTPRTVQAHCTFLSTHELHHLKKRGTAIAHCPLSNAYFSAQPFRLREALGPDGVKLGLGTDVAGGYSLDVMNSMRQAVAVSRMREGARVMEREKELITDAGQDDTGLTVDWKETLFVATAGGASALGLAAGSGKFVVGAPFDAQLIELYDEKTRIGTGALDFLEQDDLSSHPTLTEGIIEKWWCLGNERNRKGMWIQGASVKTASEV